MALWHVIALLLVTANALADSTDSAAPAPSTEAPPPASAERSEQTGAARAADRGATVSTRSLRPAPFADAGVEGREASAAPAASSSGGLEPQTAARGASVLIHNSHGTLPELARLETAAVLPAQLRELERELPRRAKELYETTEQASIRIRNATRWFTVVDVEFGLRQRRVGLAALQKRVDAHVRKATAAAQRVQELLSEAQGASEVAQSLQVRGGVRAELRHVVQEAKLARLNVRRSEASALRLQSGLAEMVGEINQVLRVADTEGPSLSRDLTRTGPNLLQTLAEFDHERGLRAALGTVLKHNLATLRDFLGTSGSRLLSHALLGAGVLLSLFWLRARAYSWPAWTGHQRSGDLIHRPLASATLLTMVVTLLVYPTYPASVVILASCVVALSGLWLLPGLDEAIRPWHSRVLLVVLLVDVGRLALVEMASLERLLLLAEGTLGATALVLVLRATKREDRAGPRSWSQFRRLVLRFWLAAFSVGVLVLALGLVHTGTILISGATLSVFTAIVWAAGHRVLASAVEILAEGGPTTPQPGRAGVRGQVVARRLETALAVLFSFLWVRGTLNGFTLWDPTAQAVRRLLELSVEAGSLKISVGSLVALLVGLVLAFYGAKVVRSVLEEDVLPRTNLGVGTRAATSTSAYYGVLILGMFLAMGAAGVELGKLTVVVGALGLGIGFGLQNIVQNFVAGLILIFGRPVNVDDRVQIGELTGIVRRIGFRASIIRTFQGAEVIVPNADLINKQVVNWTLSDPNRRMEINVGVAYGTDPERVLKLLLTVARAHPDVLDDPAPDALFLEHGSSSLDFQLRAWTTNVGFWPNVKSALTAGINRALRDEGIEIPFPQRDLHLRSVAPAVLSELNRK